VPVSLPGQNQRPPSQEVPMDQQQSRNRPQQLKSFDEAIARSKRIGRRFYKEIL